MPERGVIPSLARYSLLGRSGLRVSPLCLGTMTFGTEWGWGSAEETSRAMLERYLEAGGNFLDTADGYTNGTSEEILGRFFAANGGRDRVVLATKGSFSRFPGDPNGGGNGRKHILQALEASLRRLRTDYVDLYMLHGWDGLTPAEEVVSTLDDVVRAGKVRYLGLSNFPAWYVARAQTLAEKEARARFCALQYEYSLVERSIEREFVPAAIELGMGICPWSPLGGGVLTGKYRREAGDAAHASDSAESTRLEVMKDSPNPAFAKRNERTLALGDEVVSIARELGASPAQVAIAWVTRRPGVVSTLVGASRMDQLEDNLRALELELPLEISERLELASRPERASPYFFFEEPLRGMIRGARVDAEPPWYRDRSGS